MPKGSTLSYDARTNTGAGTGTRDPTRINTRAGTGTRDPAQTNTGKPALRRRPRLVMAKRHEGAWEGQHAIEAAEMKERLEAHQGTMSSADYAAYCVEGGFDEGKGDHDEEAQVDFGGAEEKGRARGKIEGRGRGFGRLYEGLDEDGRIWKWDYEPGGGN